MKFNCGPTWKEKFYAKIQSKENWHRWFAWHPARVGYRDCRWLETVERKGKYSITYEYRGWGWIYRPLSDPKLDISDNGVLSVDSNELARSKAGRKQIEALGRLSEEKGKG